jgi:hypothetical protein
MDCEPLCILAVRACGNDIRETNSTDDHERQGLSTWPTSGLD